MTIWVALWFVLSCILLSFFVWTLIILLRQKKVWSHFAQRYGLRYKPGKFWDSPRLDGVFEGYKIGLFASEYLRPDMRSARKMTSIEFTLHSQMPFDGAMASAGMVEIVQGSDFGREYKPRVKGWNKEYIAMGSHLGAMDAYFNTARLKALMGLMRIKFGWAIAAFRNDIFVLRVDVPYALDDHKALDALLKQMLEAARVLELDKGEKESLSRLKDLPEQLKPEQAGAAIEIDLDQSIDLEFESEEEAKTEEKPAPKDKEE